VEKYLEAVSDTGGRAGGREGGRAGGRTGGRAFCREVGLSFERMCEVQTLISQLGRDLASLGFRPAAALRGRAGGREGGKEGGCDGARVLLERLDEKGGRAYWRLVKAAVAVGLYPNVVKVVRPPLKYAKVAGGAMQVSVQARELKFFVFNQHKEVGRYLVYDGFTHVLLRGNFYEIRRTIE
jgi:hypothetical protein